MRRWMPAIAPVCAAVVLIAGGAAPRAAAAGGNQVLNDCETNGQLTHTYTLAQLQQALASMPPSVKQYTNCYDVIEKALIQARKTGTAGPAPSGGGSGGSFLPTPVIIVLVVLILAALGFAGLALARRRAPRRGPPG